MTLTNAAFKCVQQPFWFGALQVVQFKGKLNESEKIENRKEK